MNAADWAKTPDQLARVASVVSIFQAAFPDCKANLRPWSSDDATSEHLDPDSLDIGFNFPPGKTLVQLRFWHDDGCYRLIGIEAICFGLFGNRRWQFSTIANWEFSGTTPPLRGFRQQLRRTCEQLLEHFALNSAA